MEIQIQYDLPDIQNSLRLHVNPYGKAKRYRLLFFISLIILGTSFIHSINNGNVLSEGAFTTFSLIILLAFYYYVGLPFMARRIKSQTIPFQIMIDESGVTTTTSHDKNHQSWTSYSEWKEDLHIFLLYYSRNSYISFPKRLLEKPESIRKYVIENEIPEHSARQELISYSLLFLFSLYVALRVFFI